MDEQSVPDKTLVDVAQAADRDIAYIDLRARVRRERHVQRLRGRIFVSDRRTDGRARVPVCLQRREEALLCLQHLLGNGGVARREAEPATHLFRDITFDRHVSEVIQRTCVHRHSDRRIRVLGQCFDRRGELRVVQRSPVNRDGDASLIVAKALQHGLQAVDILLRPPYERKGADRRRAPQRLELRRALERGVKRAVSGGREGDGVGLQVSRVADRYREARDSGDQKRRRAKKGTPRSKKNCWPDGLQCSAPCTIRARVSQSYGLCADPGYRKSGPMTTFSTIAEPLSRTRLDSHQTAPLRTDQYASSPDKRNDAIMPSVGWWPTSMTGSRGSGQFAAGSTAVTA